jgi:hypothetical protein
MPMFFTQLLAQLPMILVAVIFGAIGAITGRPHTGYLPA